MAEPAKKQVTLDDKYTLEKGKIFVTGSQALVRLPIMMRARDVKQGKNTAGFVSGYRGSPLARLDQQLWRAQLFLEKHHVTFTPGVNEDLGATAVWGTQHTTLFDGAKYDGVFGMWYGKGPGVDRSMDVLKHANAAGTSPDGGVLALAGDDHGCDSSTLGHQSEHDFISAMIPVLHPATVEEYLDYGIYGFEMSRYAGCWVAMKCVTEVVESSASVSADNDKIKIKIPTDYTPPKDGLHIRRPDDRFAQEHRLYEKIEAAKAFARANNIDTISFDAGKKAKLGILTTGKAYTDTLQALQDLGMGKKEIEAAGVRIYKVGMVWPLEPVKLKEFTEGLDEIIVIEEKRGVLENQLKQYLYDWQSHIKISGKKSEDKEWQFRAAGELSPLCIAEVLAQKITVKDAGKKYLKSAAKQEKSVKLQGANVLRLPYYCSGCPHNTSTKLPEGSRSMVGIGCHFMVQWMDRNSEIFTHMGGEGVTWIGQAPFTEEKHIFMNLGDGTYYHSGSLAVRAAVASGVNITYKILYNDAVAMTGGQPVDGPLTVPQITRQMADEGVSKIVVVAEDENQYKDLPSTDKMADGVKIYHRDDLEKVQKEMREIPGCSILVYDQTCAAEKRRRRKRGQYPDPDKRVFINDAVCEGCGDCSEKSNCVSIEPLETELGRKRRINQSSCNKDFSCIKGFCPSFVTVNGGNVKRLKVVGETDKDTLKTPKQTSLTHPYDILVTGIGGTGVITIGAVLGMAAHLEGKGVTVLDQTGLAQKNGAVVSYLRIGKTSEDLHAVRTVTAGADLLLGCDKVVTSNSAVLEKMSPEKTKGVLNSHMTPTASFTLDTESTIDEAEIAHKIGQNFQEKNLSTVDATRVATALMGDSIATNMFMLGYAWQKGLVPVALDSIHQAIELNGVAIDANKKAFYWGRKMAESPEEVLKTAAPVLEATAPEKISETLEEIIAYRKDFLTGYQNKGYAKKYLQLVEKAHKAEESLEKDLKGFTEAVAKYAFKLMAYKDEYEVARLYTNGKFKEKLAKQFEGDYTLTFHLAPPLLAGRDEDGHLKKMTFGPWLFSVFGIMAKLKSLRGTPLDIFGYTAERKMERELIREYADMIEDICDALNVQNYKLAVELASLPASIKGFGHIKENNVRQTNMRKKVLWEAFNSPPADPIQETGDRLKVAISN
jgi:indolepyruvate ferredoxin oxidoreductase